MNKVEIPLSKTKLLLGISGSILFVLLGVFLFTVAGNQTRFSPAFIKWAGIAGILFFSATGVYGIRKMFDNKIGLTIDENGILDNTNASSIGFIKWSDITEIETAKVASTKFLLIYTTNPEYYLGKASWFKRKLMEGNSKMYGTPLSITSNTLKCKFKDLEKIVYDRFHKQRE